jgi:hypothetical protein
MNEENKLAEFLKKNYDKLDLPEDDLLTTNKIEDVLLPISNRRIVKEKKTIITINSEFREQYEYEFVPYDDIENKTYENTIDELNYGLLHLPYVQLGNNIYEKKPKYMFPNNYFVQFTKSFINVKSIRLLSVEIPKSINNITENNNIIILDILEDNVALELVPGKSVLDPLICFQLDIGIYTIEELILHFKTRLNEIVAEYTVAGHTDMFDILYNSNTGKIEIKLTDSYISTFTFHLKFWKNENEMFDYQSLWYLLGFNSYHKLDNTGADYYSTSLTNIYDFGNNPNTDSELLKMNIPYRQPNLNYNKYIYLELTNIKNNQNVINIYDMAQGLNNVYIMPDQHTNLSNIDIFGKIICDNESVEFYNKFINSPKIFENTINKLNCFHIKWYDYKGNLVNFQNINHSLTFEIIEFLDELAETNMNTKRGIYDESYYPNIIKNN